MTPSGALRLDTRASIDRVLEARDYLRVFMPRLEVTLPDADAEATRATQARVDRLVDECGCGLGAATALAALALFAVHVATTDATLGVWGAAWRGVAVLFAGATVGKVIGIARARAELLMVLRRLRALMPEPPHDVVQRAPTTARALTARGAESR